MPQNPNDEPAEKLLARIQEEHREQATRKQTQHGRVNKMKQTKVRLSIYEVLRKHKVPLLPEILLREAGFDEKTIDEFYEELRMGVKAGRIKEKRSQGRVYLEVVKNEG